MGTTVAIAIEDCSLLAHWEKTTLTISAAKNNTTFALSIIQAKKFTKTTTSKPSRVALAVKEEKFEWH